MIIKTKNKCYVTDDTTHYTFSIIDEKIGMSGYAVQYEDSNISIKCCSRPTLVDCENVIRAVFLDIKNGEKNFEFN